VENYKSCIAGLLCATVLNPLFLGRRFRIGERQRRLSCFSFVFEHFIQHSAQAGRAPRSQPRAAARSLASL